MSDALFVMAILALPLAGGAVTRVRFVRDLEVQARITICFAAGIVAIVTLMYVWSMLGVPWTRATLWIPFLVLALATNAFVWRGAGPQRPAADGRVASSVILAFFAVTTYGVMTARETCADLLYFWGPKAQRFYDAETIDIEFLHAPHHYLMHADYPPLLPLLYAWGSLASHHLSWWGALLLSAILLLATVAAFRGIAARRLGEERAGRYAVLLMAILAYGFAIGRVAGAADPLLLFFETVALAALTFGGSDRGAYTVAAIALAGAVFTKVEGAAFAAVLLCAFVVTNRRLAPAMAMAVPSVVLLSSWIFVSGRAGLIASYGMGGSGLHFGLLGNVVCETARSSSYGAFYLPWIAAVAPLSVVRNFRRALLPLLTAAGVVAYTLFFYLHVTDALFWIESSAERVLLTALMCLVVATAAASE